MLAAARSDAFLKDKTKLDVELELWLGLTAVPQFHKDNDWKTVKFEVNQSCSVCAARQCSEMRPGVTKCG